MKYSTHVITALGVSTALVASNILSAPDFGLDRGFDNYIWFILIIGFGGLFPDIDHSKSFLSRKLGFSIPIRHRGFTHTIYPYIVLMSLSLFYGNNIWTEIAFWFGLGSLLHSWGDMHTVSGVKLLYWNSASHALPKFLIWSSGSKKELFWFGFYSVLFLGSLFVLTSS